RWRRRSTPLAWARGRGASGWRDGERLLARLGASDPDLHAVGAGRPGRGVLGPEVHDVGPGRHHELVVALTGPARAVPRELDLGAGRDRAHVQGDEERAALGERGAGGADVAVRRQAGAAPGGA